MSGSLLVTFLSHIILVRSIPSGSSRMCFFVFLRIFLHSFRISSLFTPIPKLHLNVFPCPVCSLSSLIHNRFFRKQNCFYFIKNSFVLSYRLYSRFLTSVPVRNIYRWFSYNSSMGTFFSLYVNGIGVGKRWHENILLEHLRRLHR